MEPNRRRFLFGCGMGVLGAAAGPARVWGESRVRILDGSVDLGSSPVMNQVSPDFQRWMRGVRVGQAATHGALQVFWLHAKEPAPPLGVLTLDEARKEGSLLITERADASVPELVVENRAKSHVLLLAGEILVGGKQNRVLREDILLPPLSGPRPIGVYCVEQGRWNQSRKDFDSKGTVAQPSVRQQLLGRASQNRVWDSVARAAREANPSAPPSPTGSYQAIYDDEKLQTHLKEVERAVPPCIQAPTGRLSLRAGPSPASISSTRRASSRASGPSSCARTPSRRTASHRPKILRMRVSPPRSKSSWPRRRGRRARCDGTRATGSSSSSRSDRAAVSVSSTMDASSTR